MCQSHSGGCGKKLRELLGITPEDEARLFANNGDNKAARAMKATLASSRQATRLPPVVGVYADDGHDSLRDSSDDGFVEVLWPRRSLASEEVLARWQERGLVRAKQSGRGKLHGSPP